MNLPTERSARDKSGMIRYWSVLVDSLTCPGMSLSLVKIHILISQSLLISLLSLKKCLCYQAGLMEDDYPKRFKDSYSGLRGFLSP